MALCSILNTEIKYSNFLISKAVFTLLCCCNLLYAESTTSQDSLRDLANTFIDQVNLKEKPAFENESLYLSALPLYQQICDWDNYIHVLNMLSVIYYTDQNYLDFFENTTLALKVAKNKLLKSNKKYHIAVHNWASAETARSNYPKAIELFGEFVDLIDANKTKMIERAPYYQNMGTLYQELGDYDEAIRYLEKALSIRLEYNNPKDMDRIGLLTEIAQIQKLKGKKEIAIAYYHEAIKKANVLNIQSDYLDQIYLYCFQDLATIYLEKNEDSIAKEWIDKAVDLQKNRTFFSTHDTFLTLAKYWLKKENRTKALAAFQEALQITKETHFFDIDQQKKQHPTSAKVLLQLSDVHITMQNFEKAKVALYESLQVNEVNNKIQDLYNLPDSLRWLDNSVALNTMNKVVELIKRDSNIVPKTQNLLFQLQYFDHIHLVLQKMRLDFKTENAKLSLMAEAKLSYEKAIYVCYQLYQKTQDSKYIDKAFEFSEASRSILLLESRQQQRALAASQIPDSLLQKEKSINQTLNFYLNEQALLIKNKKEGWETQNKIWSQQIFELKESQKAFSRLLKSKYPRYHQLREATPLVSIIEVQESILDHKSGIVSYFIGQEYSFAFFIGASERELVYWNTNSQDKILISNLLNQIKKEPNSSTFESNFQSFCNASNSLYNRYWKGLEFYIPEQVSSITILPDDLLNYLPFEVLIKNLPNNGSNSYSVNNLDYLVEKYQLSYNYSASLIAFSIEKKSSNNISFLGIAPSFESSVDLLTCDDSQLFTLNCSEDEVVNIESLFDGTALLGSKANKKIFLENASKHSILHLATHACLDSDNPLLNRIYFNDGFLTALDLQTLNLNTDLIVLSACNTGTGELMKGEGVMSLARSLSYAGCPSSLVSLWSIDDCASSKISTGYYEQLKRGKSKHDALRESKLNYIKNTSDKIQAHPYYWAGLVQTGNTRPLIISNHNYFQWVSGLTLSIFLSFFILKMFRV